MSLASSASIPLDIPAIPAIPVRQILPWAVFAGLLFVIVLYFVSTEQGALSVFDGTYLHELVHDGRHLLGFPCH